jgi:hypothetical protein
VCEGVGVSQRYEAEVVVDRRQNGIASSSRLGDSSIPWSTVKRVSLTRDYLLLSLSYDRCSPVPLTALSEEAIEFVLSRAAAAGARIRGKRAGD